jgi:hypothetical protein
MCFLCGPLWGYMIRPTEFNSVNKWSAAEWSEVSWLVSSQLVTGMVKFGHCELLLLEAGSWGMGIRQEPRVGKISVGSPCLAVSGEDATHCKGLVCAIVNWWVRELAIEIQLLIVIICKCSTNPITNPNPVYRHSYTWQLMPEVVGLETALHLMVG